LASLLYIVMFQIISVGLAVHDVQWVFSEIAELYRICSVFTRYFISCSQPSSCNTLCWRSYCTVHAIGRSFSSAL